MAKIKGTVVDSVEYNDGASYINCELSHRANGRIHFFVPDETDDPLGRGLWLSGPAPCSGVHLFESRDCTLELTGVEHSDFLALVQEMLELVAITEEVEA